MFVMINYDIEKTRVVKVMKYLRIYLHHIQDSVFLGELTEKTYRHLCQGIQSMIDLEYDRVIIYQLQTIQSMSVKVFGKQKWIENIY